MKQSRTIFSLAVLFILFFGFNSYAQPGKRGHKGGPKKEKVQQLKIAYFTKELDLTTKQAEKFWPVYNEMADKVQQERRNAKKGARELNDSMETMSDAEAKKKMNETLNARIKEAEIQKEYLTKIGDAIGYKKAAKVVSLEIQFKRELLKRLADEKNGKSNATQE